MPYPRFQRTPTEDPVMDRVQRNIETTVEDQRRNCPLLDGVLVEDIEMQGSSTDVRVEHGLGRAYRGYIVVRSNVTGGKIGDFTPQNERERHLVLRGTAQRTSLWVF